MRDGRGPNTAVPHGPIVGPVLFASRPILCPPPPLPSDCQVTGAARKTRRVPGSYWAPGSRAQLNRCPPPPPPPPHTHSSVFLSIILVLFGNVVRKAAAFFRASPRRGDIPRRSPSITAPLSPFLSYPPLSLSIPLSLPMHLSLPPSLSLTARGPGPLPGPGLT